MQAVPSWDLFLAIFFIVSIGYSFVLQRDKVIVTLLSIYAGIVIAQMLGGPLQQFFNGDKTVANQLFIRANTNPFSIQSGLFLLTTILLAVRSGLGSRSSSSSRGALSPFELGLFSFLNSALILAAVFSFMTPDAQALFASHSRIGKVIIDHIAWWMVAPLIAVIATGGLGKSSRSDY